MANFVAISVTHWRSRLRDWHVLMNCLLRSGLVEWETVDEAGMLKRNWLIFDLGSNFFQTIWRLARSANTPPLAISSS